MRFTTSTIYAITSLSVLINLSYLRLQFVIIIIFPNYLS